MGWLDGEKDDSAMTAKEFMKSKIKEIGKEAVVDFQLTLCYNITISNE